MGDKTKIEWTDATWNPVTGCTKKMTHSYESFLRSKMIAPTWNGFDVPESDITPEPVLRPHVRAIARWAVKRGTAAVFSDFGLHKTRTQLEIARLIMKLAGGRFLIVAPLGVRQEFKRDAAAMEMEITPIRRLTEAKADGLYLTNYESVRDGKLDPRKFTGLSLDEAAILRGMGSSKTFRSFMDTCSQAQVKYKFVATATPSPNEFEELLTYAAFLDVMDIGQARTRFFKRDSTKADHLTLHKHKEREFWLWVSTWAIFLQRPSDLGYSDDGYNLPEMTIHWHQIAADHRTAGNEANGQGKLLRDAAISLRDAAREKRDSLGGRIAKMLEIRAVDPGAHRLIWHDLESERHAIGKAIPGIATLYGSQDLDEREQMTIDFSDGKIPELAAKPVIAGAGCNFQRHCSRAIFLGIGFKFNDFIQAIHRIHRFQQGEAVHIDLIYTESEREVRRVLLGKWERHSQLRAQMQRIIQEYGLAKSAIDRELERSLGVDRVAVLGERFTCVHNDCVLETRSMETESVHLILTSPPFSTQYEYTPSYNDFGHTDSNEHFWAQMDFLTPELFRVLKPGRVAAIHVKDRVVQIGYANYGFQTVYPFHADCIAHFKKHGFGFLGMKTIVTDVVRENNQTYRLGWTEQCKDGSKMGVGMPEYLLLFRKPATDRSNGYADLPVVKNKDQYTRARWQVDAHGFARSNGNRLLSTEEISKLPWERIFKLYRMESTGTVYDFERHVALGESLESKRRLPPDFMLLQPQSWHPDVWTDITRMRSLNSSQSQRGQQMHLCPMQFDLADRVIAQFTMRGETVYDPFGGLMTVPLRATRLARRGIGCELNATYFRDGVVYCQQEELKQMVPTLFDLENDDATPESQTPNPEL